MILYHGIDVENTLDSFNPGVVRRCQVPRNIFNQLVAVGRAMRMGQGLSQKQVLFQGPKSPDQASRSAGCCCSTSRAIWRNACSLKP